MPREDLRRELGFWDALAIGAGTMIGAGIFLLAGTALELTGPAAIISYVAAGSVCIMTAASVSELATGMPTSGGDYFFVSRSLGPAMGAISGVGVWLSLTVAIAFYLFGLGEYLARLTPLTPLTGALVGGVVLVGLNVIGARETGRLQVLVVLALLAVLGVFSVSGLFNMEGANFTPFFPFGTGPVLSTTALVFVSFLGFVKIAAVAEEIEDPARNLPRALIGSVGLVTLLYILILLVIAGVFPQPIIGQVSDPLTEAARFLFGNLGGLALIFAGLLATLSSANASILSSSRINLAMARDRMFPQWLSQIHDRLLTPYRAILATGLLALAFLFIESLEDLAKLASSLQLYSYAAINVGCIVLRVADPDWYRPSYRAPAFPYLQIVGAGGCIAIILYSGLFSQLAILGLIAFSLAWYFSWGRSRVGIENALSDFRSRWSRTGVRSLFAPAVRYAAAERKAAVPAERAIDTATARRVMVALANPEHEDELLRMGRFAATGRREGGRVFGLHLVRVPLQTPLKVARDRFHERRSIERTISELAQTAERMEDGGTDGRTGEGETADRTRDAGDEAGGKPGRRRPLDETSIEAVTDVAHDVFGSLVSETRRWNADLLLMGWRGGFTVGRIYDTPVQRVMSNLPADLAVLKSRGLGRIDSVLVPWGGGIHARSGLEIAVRVASATGATIDLLRIVKPGIDAGREERNLTRAVEEIVEDFPRVRYRVQHDASITRGIQASLAGGDYDLVIIGASREWAIGNVLFGAIPDVIADRADCSVLMIRRARPERWAFRLSEGVKRMKEFAGLTTSPEESGAPAAPPPAGDS